jgi:hypothetical protein
MMRATPTEIRRTVMRASDGDLIPVQTNDPIQRRAKQTT